MFRVLLKIGRIPSGHVVKCPQFTGRGRGRPQRCKSPSDSPKSPSLYGQGLVTWHLGSLAFDLKNLLGTACF